MNDALEMAPDTTELEDARVAEPKLDSIDAITAAARKIRGVALLLACLDDGMELGSGELSSVGWAIEGFASEILAAADGL